MNCPVCEDTLREIERSGVLIDVCPRCKGVWLDRGELEKLLDREAGMSGAVPPAGAYSPRPGESYGQPRGYDPHRDHDDDDRDHDRHEHLGQGAPHGRPRRRRGWLGEILGGLGDD